MAIHVVEFSSSPHLVPFAHRFPSPLLLPPLPKSKVHSLSVSPCRISPFNSSQWTNLRSGFMVLRPNNCLPEKTHDADSSKSVDGVRSEAAPESGISSNSWCAGLGGLGFVETSYLSYLKVSGSEAVCPVGGGSCGDVLSSDYSLVYGVPLPLIGMAAYGLVLVLGLQLTERVSLFGISKSDGRLLLLSISASMAAASAYFLYLLSTKFAGSSCLYCLASATLSFSLFFITIKEFGLQDIQKVLAIPLCTAAAVIAVLGTSYSSAQPILPRSAEVDLSYYTSDITMESSPLALSLAKHLHSIGAKMYGAFWCSHCLEQKEMFGVEAMKFLDYVECFPDGYRKGVKIAKFCADAGIEGFPTWIINGQVLSGEQELSDLASVSGFNLDQFPQQVQ